MIRTASSRLDASPRIEIEIEPEIEPFSWRNSRRASLPLNGNYRLERAESREMLRLYCRDEAFSISISISIFRGLGLGEYSFPLSIEEHYRRTRHVRADAD